MRLSDARVDGRWAEYAGPDAKRRGNRPQLSYSGKFISVPEVVQNCTTSGTSLLLLLKQRLAAFFPKAEAAPRRFLCKSRGGASPLSFLKQKQRLAAFFPNLENRRGGAVQNEGARGGDEACQRWR